MWEMLATASILLVVCFAVLYDDGRFLLILVSALAFRLLIIPIFPEITTYDISDYFPYLREFSNMLETEGILSTMISYTDRHVEFYTILYPGYIYAIYGGDGIVLIRIINASLSILTLPLLNEINKLVFDKRFKRWQAVIFLFWPSYVFFSVEIGRTVVGIIFILLSVYLFLIVLDRFEFKILLLFVTVSAAVTMTRIYYVVYPLGLITIMYLYKSYLNRQSRSQLGVTFSIVVTGSIISITLFPYEFSIERINSLADGIAHGESAYLTTIYPTSFLDLAWYVPLQGIYFQFSPFLWDVLQIGGLLTVIAFLQASLVLVLLAASTVKFRSPLMNWRSGLILLTALGVALLLGIGVKNTGAAIRWRLPSELLILAVTSTIVDHEYLDNDED